MKKYTLLLFIYFLLFGGLLFGGMGGCSQVDADDPDYLSASDFEDPAFRDAVHESTASWLPLNEVVGNEFYELFVNRRGISSINGVERFVNLRYFHADDNDISDVSPLSECTSLYAVYMANNSVVDVTPLEDLSELRILDLSYNQITDVTSLGKISGLYGLILDGNPIETGITELAKLKELNYLDLSETSTIREDDYNQLVTALPDCDIDGPEEFYIEEDTDSVQEGGK